MKFSVTKHTQFTAKENLGNITHATCREGKSWNGELSELTQEKNLRNKDDSDPGGVDAEEAPGNIRQQDDQYKQQPHPQQILLHIIECRWPKKCRSYRLFIENHLFHDFVQCTVMGSWSKQRIQSILGNIFSSIK